MFPPNNPHYPRNRSCTRCLNGTKRKGLYAVFTIGVFLCIIFAVTLMYEHHVLDVSKQHVLGTMHQSYHAESLKFVNESRRRESDTAPEPPKPLTAEQAAKLAAEQATREAAEQKAKLAAEAIRKAAEQAIREAGPESTWYKGNAMIRFDEIWTLTITNPPMSPDLHTSTLRSDPLLEPYNPATGDWEHSTNIPESQINYAVMEKFEQMFMEVLMPALKEAGAEFVGYEFREELGAAWQTALKTESEYKTKHPYEFRANWKQSTKVQDVILEQNWNGQRTKAAGVIAKRIIHTVGEREIEKGSASASRFQRWSESKWMDIVEYLSRQSTFTETTEAKALEVWAEDFESQVDS